MGIGSVWAVLLGLVVMMLVGLPIAALILKLSVRIAAGFSPGFLRCLGVVALATVLGFFVNAAVSMLFGIGGMDAAGMGGGDPEAAAAAMAGAGAAVLGAMGLSLLVGFLLTALLVNLLIKRGDGSAIGFGRSLLVVLVYAIILTVVGIIVGVGLAMLGFGAAALAL